MLPLESLKLIKDMQQAAADIAHFTRGRSLPEFLADRQLRMAVERGFEILGEALWQLHKIDSATAERITDWRAIVGFRNVLIHGYTQVHADKTWDIVVSELPILQSEIARMLA